MKILQTQKARLVLLGIAIVAMLVLAMGLPRVRLDPGLPFEQIWQFLVGQFGGFGAGGAAYLPPAGNGESLARVMRTIFFVALMAFPIAVVLVVLDPELRRSVLRSMLRLLIIFTLIGLFLSRRDQLKDLTLDTPANIDGQGQEQTQVPPLTDEVFSADKVAPWVVWALSLTAGLIAAVAIVGVVNQIRKNRAAAQPLEEIARQAEAAIGELELGANLRNTIIRCYIEMSQVVADARGVRRGNTVTAREFITYLLRAGLPERPVERLTELFEKARYGTGETMPEDESAALSSLQAIVNACRSMS